MAIIDSNNPSGQTQTSQTFSQRTTQAQSGANAQAGAAPQPRGLNLRSIGNISRIPMSRNANSEIIAKLQDALAKAYGQDDIKSQFEIRLMPLDNNTYRQLRFSAMVVIVRSKDEAKAKGGIAYFTLLIQATGADLQPITENVLGRMTEVIRTPDFAWDEDLAAIVHNAVTEAYPRDALLPCDGCVLGRHTFDPENETMVHLTARNALAACSTAIDQVAPGFSDLNLGDAQFGALSVVIRAERDTLMDDAGHPMRSDIQIELTETIKQNGVTDNRPNNGDRGARLGYASAFVDIGWAPLAPQAGTFMGHQLPGNQMVGVPVQSQKFAANLVITHAENDELMTLPAILWNIAMTTAVAENWNYLNCYRNTGGARRTHDIGALNYEGNLNGDLSGVGQLIPTSTDDFGQAELFQLGQLLIQPGIAISVDVPDCGPQTNYLGILAAAANGNPQAIAAVVAAADVLTDGLFGRDLQNEPLFVNTNNRVHLGYRIDEQGMKADIRDLDYVSLATIKGAHDLEMVRKWSDTFAASDIPLPIRLEQRAKIIREIYPSAVFTGMATRVTFGPKRLQHLVSCIMAKGVRPEIQTTGFGLTSSAQRGYAGFAGSGLYMPGQVAYSVGHQRQGGNNYGNAGYGFNQRFR